MSCTRRTTRRSPDENTQTYHETYREEVKAFQKEFRGVWGVWRFVYDSVSVVIEIFLLSELIA